MLYVQVTRTSLLRAARTRGAGQLALGRGGGGHCTYAAYIPASGVPYAPRTVAPTPGGDGRLCVADFGLVRYHRAPLYLLCYLLWCYLLTTALLTNASSATTVRAYNMHMHMHMRMHMRMQHMRRACFPYPGPGPTPHQPTPRASRPAPRARPRARAPSKESDPRVHPPLGLSLRRVRCARRHDGRDWLVSMDGARGEWRTPRP